MGKPSQSRELELFPDAWARFERAVDVVAKSPPQHRTRAGKPRLMRFGLTLLVRPSIGKALADDALGREFGAYEIVITERRARVVAEVELGKVAMQVLFLAMLVDAAPARRAIVPVILVIAWLVVWPGWLRTAQAQSWVSEESGGLRHIGVTLNKSRT